MAAMKCRLCDFEASGLTKGKAHERLVDHMFKDHPGQ